MATSCRATYRPTDRDGGTDIAIGPNTDPVSAAVLKEAWGSCRIRNGVGILECREHDNNPRLAHLRDEQGRVRGAWVYVRVSRDKWVVCHSPNGIGKNLRSHTINVMTDQHRWGIEYHHRVADHVGYPATKEYPLGNEACVDLLVEGDACRLGLEVQHSDQSTPQAIARDRIRQAAGLTAVWSVDRRGVPWEYKVAHVETNELPHGQMPLRSWPLTTGPRALHKVKCDARNADLLGRCPKPRRRNWCGEDHPVWRPINADNGRTIYADEITELVPAGELVRLNTGTKQGVILVSATDYERWQSDFADQVIPPSKRANNGLRSCQYDTTLLIERGAAHERPVCEQCGRQLFLTRAGRTICEACRRDPPFVLQGNQYAFDVYRLLGGGGP